MSSDKCQTIHGNYQLPSLAVVVSGPAITFKIDPRLAAQFGVTASDVANTATTAMSGDAASSILQQDRLITVRVVFPADLRTSLEKVRALPVRSASETSFGSIK